MKMKQNVLLFDFERGDKITVSAVNAKVLLAYQKFNNLIPDNVQGLTTGQFRGETSWKSLLYPNYSGTMTYNNVLSTCDPADEDFGLTDTMCMKLVREADEILKYLQEV